MSTKTTFKRIALVAVASLGFGLLGSVTANAAATDVTAIAATATASATQITVTATATLDGTAGSSAGALAGMVAGVVGLKVVASPDADLTVGTTIYATIAGLATVTDGSTSATAATKTFVFATKVAPAAGLYQFRVFGTTAANASTTVEAFGVNVNYNPPVNTATDASIKATATSVNISAVSLTTVEPSNRVGVAVIATPAATFKNDTAATDTTQDSHKALLAYVLTKPAGSAATLSATSATILSGGVIAAAGASAARSGTDITFTPDVAGTYSVTAWHESVVDGALSTSEASATKSYVIGANELKMTISTNGSLVNGADDAGSLLVKIALTGADGKGASLSANESIVVTRTAGTGNIDFVTYDGTFGNYAGNYDPATTATYTFNSAQFSSTGVAAFLVNDATAAGLSTWTINGVGGTAAALSYSMTTS